MEEKIIGKKQKRILAIHDISCFGRCSLTVALPIISAAGIECTVLPTAVLSTHTGGFSEFTFRDLTEDVEKILAHWDMLGITFDGIYTGYLGSFEQLDIVSNIIKKYKNPFNTVIVDPVLGDAGVLYRNFDRRFACGMAKLCALADIIVPNVTEAAFLLNAEYRPVMCEDAYMPKLLQELRGLGAPNVVLTGVSRKTGEIGAAAYDGCRTSFSMTPAIDGMYHGTGDVFASALSAACILGKDLPQAADIAVKYTYSAIALSHRMKTDPRAGVPFEMRIPYLIDLLCINNNEGE